MTAAALLFPLALSLVDAPEHGLELDRSRIAAGAGERIRAEVLAERGWLALHDLDYDAAERLFRTYQKELPSSPRGFIGEAASVWLRELERRQDLDVTRFVDSTHFADEDTRPRDPEAETRFENLLARARELAEAEVAASPESVDALYYLGTVHGLRAAFEATIRHSANGALTAAKEARRWHRMVIDRDPRYFDAYLALGVYNYATGSLPFYVRWVAILAGHRGHRDDGVRELEVAARHGATTVRDAKAILTVVYVREGRTDDALKLIRELEDEAPHNHVLRLNEAYCLVRLGRYFEAAESYGEALRVARPGARFARADVRLLQGRSYLYAGDGRRARAAAEEVLGDAGLEAEVHTRARLLSAQALDVLERRVEALAIYRRVSSEPDADGSRSRARRGLRNPFSPPSIVPSAEAAESRRRQGPGGDGSPEGPGARGASGAQRPGPPDRRNDR